MKKVLVTGGAGYIGSHVCKALAQAGYEPVCYDSLEFGHEWAVQWGPLEIGRIEDTDFLLTTCRRYQPVAVMHFAAYAYVGESVADPARYYLNNVAGTLSLLTAMRQATINKIIFSSSCATYGLPESPRITEHQPQNPINPYGRSKLMIEQILQDYASAYGLIYATLRYFNAAGADPDMEIGEEHQPETHLIPLAIQAALSGSPLSIFGTDYPTADGTAIRDYIHVTDLATAHVAALIYLEEQQKNIAVNLGTGQGHSIREVMQSVEEVTGKKVPWTAAPRRPGDPPQLVADPSLAQKRLSWHPQTITLRDMIASTFSWQTRHAQ